MVKLTGPVLNFIIHRYLQESGFEHSAFAFKYESGVIRSEIDSKLVPPASLVRVVMKGLEHIEMEVNLANIEDDEDEDFSLLEDLDIITKDVSELRKMVDNHKKKQVKGKEPAIVNKGRRGGIDRPHSGQLTIRDQKAVNVSSGLKRLRKKWR